MDLEAHDGVVRRERVLVRHQVGRGGHGETSLSAQQDVVVAQALQLADEEGEAGDDGGGGHGGVDQAAACRSRRGPS